MRARRSGQDVKKTRRPLDAGLKGKGRAGGVAERTERCRADSQVSAATSLF